MIYYMYIDNRVKMVKKELMENLPVQGWSLYFFIFIIKYCFFRKSSLLFRDIMKNEKKEKRQMLSIINMKRLFDRKGKFI